MESADKASTPTTSTFRSIEAFAFKTVIVVAAIFLVVTYLDYVAEQRLAALHESFTHVGGRAFWSSVEQEIAKQADPKSDLSPEEKQKLLAQIRAISNRWRPFISEALAAFEGRAEPPKQ